jgi:outer membrane protein, adhesin transport system
MSDSIDFSSLTGLEIRALSMEVITAITPEKFATFTIPQLHSLTSKQLTWLTGAQWDALLPTQKSMLFARFSIKPIEEVKPQVKPRVQTLAFEPPQAPLPKPKLAAVPSEAADLADGKPAVSSIASRFMNPSLMTGAETKKEVQPKRVTAKRASQTKSLSLAHSAVYVAVITLLTSGDFLTTAYSQQAEALSAMWSPKMEEVVQAPLQTMAEQGVTQSSLQRLPSGLIMPPESAVAQPGAVFQAALSAAVASAKPTPQPVATVAVSATIKTNQPREDVMCTVNTQLTSAKTALDEYMNNVPRKSSVVASLMAERDKEASKAVNAILPPHVLKLAANTVTAMPESATAQKSGDPDRYNSASWTTMSQATDLPPRIAALGEDLISVVIKELPSNKSSVNAMSFEEFKLRVKEAVVASPDVGIVSSQVGQSQASKSLAGASLLPQVSGTAETGRRNAGRDPYIDGSKPYDRRGSNYGFSISQLVFDFGSALSGMRAGEARVLAQQELLNSKKSEQALKTISTFVELERAKAQLKLARQNANSRLSVVNLVKERSELGGGTKADIVRVESKYAEALSSISLMETRLSNAEAAYREAFGVTAKDIVNGPLHEFAIEGLNTNAEELANAYPGLQQLARLRDASLEDYKSVSAKALPSLQLAYNNSINGVNGPTIPVDSPSRSSSMVLQLKYEFYTGGADTARKNEALYKSQQAWEEFQSGLRQYQKVLSQSQAEIRNNEDLIAARKASANSAIDSMRAVREQFSFNRGSLLDLITVQEGLYQAGRDLIDASADRILVRYRLLHLTAQLDKMFDLGTLVSMNAKD